MNSGFMAGDEFVIDGSLAVHGLPDYPSKQINAAKSPDNFPGQGHAI